MASEVASAEMAAAIEQIDAGLDALARVGVAPIDAGDARRLIAELEELGRRVQAAQIAVLGEIERRGLHKVDGHASAKVLVRHVAKLSDPEASRRAQVGRALRDLPVVAAGFAAGRIGRCQVERIARAHANVRVRQRLIGQDEELAILAASVPYRRFDSNVSDWVSLMDEDGTCDTAERNHTKRDCRHVQDPDGSWRTVVFHGSLQGAVFDDILRHFIAAEFEADWAKARLDHGDATTKDHLVRTDAQRRYDAFLQVAQVAAAAGIDLGGAGGQITTDIVIGHELFERLLARLAADQPQWGDQVAKAERPGDLHEADDADTASGVQQGDVVGPPVPFGSPGPHRLGDRDPFEVSLLGVAASDPAYRCATLDGHRIDPTEATVNALTGHVRRVVLGADSVVTDLGRRSRLFRGGAALAVRLGHTECYWPGCHVPVSDCQLDHLEAWEHGGATDPANGGPTCGRHNRLKHHGYRARRDPTGEWQILRPDGTQIE